MIWIVVVFFVVLLLAVQTVIHLLLQWRYFGRGSYPDYPTALYTYEDFQNQYEREPVSFLSGRNRLQGYIYGAPNNKGLIVLAHGIGGGHENYINVIKWFVDRSWCVFAYDSTGSCESEGSGTRGLVQSALDLDAALTHIEGNNRIRHLPVMLFGHSWGGYAVTAGLAFGHEVEASAALAAYDSPTELLLVKSRHVLGRLAGLLSPFLRFSQFLTFGRYASLSAVDSINAAGIPVLIVHGDQDETISVDGAALIAKRESITNDKVRYLYLRKPGQNGHTTILRSADAVSYIDHINEKYDSVFEQYEGQVPNEVRLEFLDGVDRKLLNQDNTELLLQIEQFYERALAD